MCAYCVATVDRTNNHAIIEIYSEQTPTMLNINTTKQFFIEKYDTPLDMKEEVNTFYRDYLQLVENMITKMQKQCNSNNDTYILMHLDFTTEKGHLELTDKLPNKFNKNILVYVLFSDSTSVNVLKKFSQYFINHKKVIYKPLNK